MTEATHSRTASAELHRKSMGGRLCAGDVPGIRSGHPSRRVEGTAARLSAPPDTGVRQRPTTTAYTDRRPRASSHPPSAAVSGCVRGHSAITFVSDHAVRRTASPESRRPTDAPGRSGAKQRPEREARSACVRSGAAIHMSTSVTQQNRGSAVPVDATLLGQMVRAIVDDVDPDRIILFGSHARREARPDSDVDLIVVEREPFGPDRSRFVEMNRLYDTLSHFFVPKDILVFSSEEVERWRDSINHVLARSLREGVVLYVRPDEGSPTERPLAASA